MRRLAILGAMALAAGVACSSFAEEPSVGSDAGADAGTRARFHIEPSLVVLEAGRETTVEIVIDERPFGALVTTSEISVTGLPEGVKHTVTSAISSEGTSFGLKLEAARDAEGIDALVKVVAAGAEASFDLRTITKTAPVLDETYGDKGRAFAAGGRSRDESRGVVVQPDGKVIVAGGYNTGYTRVPAIARYGTNGALDPTFGAGGIVLLEDHSDSLAVGVALQGDGKILVLEAFDFSVTRLTASGKIDPEFGLGGLTFAQWNVDSAATAIAVQSDGRIVVGGRALGTSADFGVVRYTTSGALDTTFNGTGRTTTSVASGDDVITALAIDSGGSIVAAGTANVGGRTHVAVARFDGNGTAGGTTTYSSNASADDIATAIGFAAGQKVLVAGTHRETAASDRGFVLRFDSSLTLDTTFDGDGVRALDLGGSTTIDALVFTPSALVVGGAAAGKGAIARLLSDGTLDATFGTGGIVTTPIGDSSSVRALALEANGSIVSAGGKRVGTDIDVAVARYTTNGALDTTWGVAGVVAMPFGHGDAGVRAAARASDGTLVVAGYAYNGLDFDILVARFLPDGKLDPSFGNGTGRVLYDRPGSSQFAYGVAVLPNKKVIVSGQGGPGTVVLRLNADGSLDSSFGAQGVKVISEGDAFGLAVRNADLSMTVAGAAPGRGFFASRLTQDGELDTTFGQNGIVTTQFDADARGVAFALDPSRNLVIAGHVDFKAPPNFFDLAVARFDAQGALDPTFDGDGKTTLNTSDVELFYATALQSDGKILVAGRASRASEASSFAVFRLHTTGVLDSSFGKEGRANLDVGPGSQASALVVQPSGTILVAGRGTQGGAVMTLLSAKGATVWPGGAVTTPLDGEAFAILRDENARFIAAGYERVGLHEEGVVLRYRR